MVNARSVVAPLRKRTQRLRSFTSQTAPTPSCTASYRRVLNCEECGEELKEATIEIDHDFGNDAEDQAPSPEGKKAHEHEWEIETCDASPTTEHQTTDRNGRPIKNTRYMKTLYGVECHVDVKCTVEGCAAEVEFIASASETASSFEELA